MEILLTEEKDDFKLNNDVILSIKKDYICLNKKSYDDYIAKNIKRIYVSLYEDGIRLEIYAYKGLPPENTYYQDADTFEDIIILCVFKDKIVIKIKREHLSDLNFSGEINGKEFKNSLRKFEFLHDTYDDNEIILKNKEIEKLTKEIEIIKQRQKKMIHFFE